MADLVKNIDVNYQEFVDDVLVLETEYEYVISEDLDGFNPGDLVLKLATGYWYAVIGEDENLILLEPCFDCYDHTYSRVD